MIRAKSKKSIKIDNSSELQTSSLYITNSKVSMAIKTTLTINIRMRQIIM